LHVAAGLLAASESDLQSTRVVDAVAKERTMAVPKKKTSKSKTRSRRASAWKLQTPPRSICPRCGNAKTPHTVCGDCGWYRDRVVVEV
jgi:large subunit ribosomal protein L32